MLWVAREWTRIPCSYVLKGITGSSAMSHILKIPDDLYAALQEAAKASGLTPLDWIAAHLGKNGEGQADSTSARTLADLFAGRRGRLRSAGEEPLFEKRDELVTAFVK